MEVGAYRRKSVFEWGDSSYSARYPVSDGNGYGGTNAGGTRSNIEERDMGR